MKRYLTLLLLLFGMTACTPNPEPPVKSTMDPAHAEATTAAFIATRAAKTVIPAATQEPARFATLVCSVCAAQGVDINIWEFAGSNPGKAVMSLPDNTVVQVVETVMADDGLVWYQINFNGTMGWIASDFVKEG
jgi:hypothetical protein